MRNKELSLREDALDREATLMNVLKSVNQKSEPDLVEVTKETTSSTKTSGFNWFRSKSKENVLDQPVCTVLIRKKIFKTHLNILNTYLSILIFQEF